MCEDISYVPIRRDAYDYKTRYNVLKAEYNNHNDLSAGEFAKITIETTCVLLDNDYYVDAVCILREFTVIGQLEIVNGIDYIIHDNNEYILKFIDFLKLKYYNPIHNK